MADSAKFMAVGEPFAFRVSKDIEGDNDGKLYFSTDKATEVKDWVRVQAVRVRQADGTLAEEKREFAVDCIDRCREYVRIGRLAEVTDAKGVPTLSPEKAQAEAEADPADVPTPSRRRGR